MAGIEEVLERLVTDPGFRTKLEQNPKEALADYDLSDDDLQMLATQVSPDAGESGRVEQRTSKSGLAGLLGGLAGGGTSATSSGGGIGSDDPFSLADAARPHEGGEGQQEVDELTAPPQEKEIQDITFTRVLDKSTPAPGAEGAGDLAAPEQQEKAFDAFLKIGDIEGETADESPTTDPTELAAPDPDAQATAPGPIEQGDITLKRGSTASDGPSAGGGDEVVAPPPAKGEVATEELTIAYEEVEPPTTPEVDDEVLTSPDSGDSSELKEGGHEPAEMKDADVSADELKEAGFDDAGQPDEELAAPPRQEEIEVKAQYDLKANKKV